jgi:hypothetical protein
LDDAFAVGDVLIPHALRALGAAPEDELRKPLVAAIRWIAEAGRTELSARDLQRGPYVLKGSAQLCERVLKRLAELGWVRLLPSAEAQPGARGPGKPSSAAYETHPRLLAGPPHD